MALETRTVSPTTPGPSYTIRPDGTELSLRAGGNGTGGGRIRPGFSGDRTEGDIRDVIKAYASAYEHHAARLLKRFAGE